MAQTTDYGRFTVMHFTDAGLDHAEDFGAFAPAGRHFEGLIDQAGVVGAQLYGWLADTGEPHALKEWDRNTPTIGRRPKRASVRATTTGGRVQGSRR